MHMTDWEITQEYEHAKDKRTQVSILADENCVKKKDMALYLRDHLGLQVDNRFFNANRMNKEDKVAKVTREEMDQTAKADAGKPRLTLVPMQIVFDVAEVREYGNRKYPDGGPDNWKRVTADRYREAAFRHFLRYIDNPKGRDEESGILHRKHLECNLAFLAELEKEE